MIESDSRFARFITQLRSKTPSERDEMVLAHRKDVARHNQTSGTTALELYSRHFFLAANGWRVNEIDFAKAISSDDLRVKRLGYLGATFVSSEEMHLSLIEDVRSDLKSEDTAQYALKFLANISLANQEYQSLVPCIQSAASDHRGRPCVVSFGITGSISEISVVDRSPSVSLAKLQIVIDKLRNSSAERDVGYLTKDSEVEHVKMLLTKTDKYYVRTKCLQFFHVMAAQGIPVDLGVLKFVDDSINLSRLLKKPLGEIAYYMQAVDLLLFVGYETQKTSTFIFKMLESECSFFVGVAIRMSRIYNVYRDIAMEKCLHEGLEHEDNLEVFTSLIDENNYRRVCGRKDEILLMLEGRDCTPSEIRGVVNAVFRKVLVFADSALAASMFIGEPLLCIEEPCEGLLVHGDLLTIFRKLEEKSDPNNFCLLYQAMVGNITAPHLSLILARHLVILESTLVSGNTQQHIPYTLSHLLTMMLKLGDHLATRSKLIAMFRRISSVVADEDLKDVLLRHIALRNVFAKEKVCYLGKDVFVEYIFDETGGKRSLEITYPVSIATCDVYVGSFRLSPRTVGTGEHEATKTYDLHRDARVKVCAEFGSLFAEAMLS